VIEPCAPAAAEAADRAVRRLAVWWTRPGDVAAFTLPAAPDAAAAVSSALDASAVVAALHEPVTELGVTRPQLRAVVEETLTAPYANPHPAGIAP
jgi:hypothetical protein